MPRDERKSILSRYMQSREFGFGLPLTEEQCYKLNTARVGQQYNDAEEAKTKDKLLTSV